MNPIDSMWTEKYRPKKIDDMVGNDIKEKIKAHLKEPSKMQHLLLSSFVGGTGKTTTAKIIISELGADALILNASDDRKIETVRNKVNSFVKTKSSVEGMRRIVFFDEADGLTFDAQQALKNLMETYSSNALFILTCNNIKKINDKIQGRCFTINFALPNKLEILDYLKMICESEELEYTEDGLRKIIEINYPSIRNCVQVLQALHTEGKTATIDTAKSADEEYQKMWDLINTNKDYKTVKQYLFEHDVNVRELNNFFWFKAVEADFIKMMQITCSNEKAFKDGQEIIIFVTSLIDMVK